MRHLSNFNPLLGGHGGQLFKYLQTIQSYLAPPACAVFLIGMLWPRLTEKGALSSMIFGLILGLTRLIMDVVYPQPHCGAIDDRPGFVKLHFMYYGMYKVLTNCTVLSGIRQSCFSIFRSLHVDDKIFYAYQIDMLNFLRHLFILFEMPRLDKA